MELSKYLLLVAGILSFSVALFQAVITFSPAWSLYFGAPEVLISNISLLYLTGFIATVFFMIFGLYALSGVGLIRRLPLLRIGLLGIGSLYVLRGSVIIPIFLMIMGYFQFSEPIPATALSSSLVSLIIGLFYLIGTITSWQRLQLKMKK